MTINEAVEQLKDLRRERADAARTDKEYAGRDMQALRPALAYPVRHITLSVLAASARSLRRSFDCSTASLMVIWGSSLICLVA